MVIGIDVDDTLIDCGRFLEEYGVPYFKKDRDLTKYFDTDCFDVSFLDWKKFWLEYNDIYQLEGKCVEGAVEKVHSWKEQGHKIIIVTARGNRFLGFEPSVEKENTLAWLKKNGIEYDDIYFSERKGTIIRQLGIDVMLEDSKSQVRDIYLWKPSTKIYMRNTPFNQNFRGDVKRFDSFYEIEL